MDHHSTDRSRRSFLQVFTWSALVLPIGIGCSGSGSGAAPQPVGNVAAGNVKDLPVGTLQALAGQPLAIGRDDGGVYAMTLTCTHAGCDMASSGSVAIDGISCACHGSRFDANGSVVSGPATSPLVHFAVSIDSAGNMNVDGSKEVGASTRTPAA